MAYTAHGHHIPGTFERDHGAGRTRKCGGVEACEHCIKESSRVLTQVISLDDKRPKTVELVSYVKDERIVLGEVEVELILADDVITTNIKVDSSSSLHIWLELLSRATGTKIQGNLNIFTKGED